MMTWNVPDTGRRGSQGAAHGMAVPPAVVQVMLTGAPPGNGLISLSVVTVAGRSPVFSTSKLQVMVWPGVAVVPGQSLFALAPVTCWACAGFATISVPTTAATSTSVRRHDR